MYHIFFNHLSIDGQLGCSVSWLLQIMQKWTFRVHIYLELVLLFSLNTQQWNCWIIWKFCFKVFKEHPYYFAQWLHLFVFSPIVYKDCLFFTSLPTLVISCLFDDSHSNRCEVMSHGFDFYFLENYLSTFLCTCWPFVSLIWKNVHSDPLPIF